MSGKLRVLAGLVLVAIALPAAAQFAPAPLPLTPQQSLAAPSWSYFSSAMDSLTALVPYREHGEIEQESTNAAAEQLLAAQQEERGKRLAAMAETRIRMKEVEIDGFKTQIDLARQAKNKLRKQELEARRKVAEMEKSLLERRRDLRKREIELARALKDFHGANGKAQKIELDLSSLRMQRASLPTPPVSAAAQTAYFKLESDLRSIEVKVLRARVEVAGKRRDVADRETGVAKMRLQVFESQNKLAKGS